MKLLSIYASCENTWHLKREVLPNMCNQYMVEWNTNVTNVIHYSAIALVYEITYELLMKYLDTIVNYETSTKRLLINHLHSVHRAERVSS